MVRKIEVSKSNLTLREFFIVSIAAIGATAMLITAALVGALSLTVATVIGVILLPIAAIFGRVEVTRRSVTENSGQETSKEIVKQVDISLG